MLYYAGIGSRETPIHIQHTMRVIGEYLYHAGWTLRSGNADGADKAFAQSVTDIKKEIYLPWEGYNHSTSALHPENYPFTESEEQLAMHVHPAWHKCSPAARKMHMRNIRIMLGLEQLHGPTVVPVKMVICWTDKGRIKGGTAQAIRLANQLKIPIFNLGVPKDQVEMDKLEIQLDQFIERFKEKANV